MKNENISLEKATVIIPFEEFQKYQKLSDKLNELKDFQKKVDNKEFVHRSEYNEEVKKVFILGRLLHISYTSSRESPDEAQDILKKSGYQLFTSQPTHGIGSVRNYFTSNIDGFWQSLKKV